MRRNGRVVLRIGFILVVPAMIAISLAPSGRSRSPYLSALSDLAAGSPVYASPCHHMRCSPSATCERIKESNTNCASQGGRCINPAC